MPSAGAVPTDLLEACRADIRRDRASRGVLEEAFLT
jgi:hypothetical protein